MPIAELGHVGLNCFDLATMRDFYSSMLGLTVTDGSVEEGIVFLSARPEEEHHELALAGGRTAAEDVKLVQQVSWRVDSLATLLDFHKRFKEAGVKIQQEITHGNAYGIYFWDPEGNRIEVYVRVPLKVTQPFRKAIDYDLSEEEFLAEAQRLLEEDGPAFQGVLGGVSQDEAK